MKTKQPQRRIVVLLAFGLAALAAQAQPQTQPGEASMRRHVMVFSNGELEGAQVVQGAPYCADAVHETVRTLADGNRIVNKTTSRQCRDGQGRMRQEVGEGARKRVFLRDPVAKESWLLDPESKTAMPLNGAATVVRSSGGDRTEMRQRIVTIRRELAEKLRPGAEHPAAPVPPTPPVPPVPPEPPVPVRVIVGPGHDLDVAMPRIPLPPPVAFQARAMAPRGPGVVALLPAETLDGLRAEHKRTTWTIEAGRIGNEKPITMVREVWTSPELGITLRSHDFDPLAGEENFRLQNIARAEPDPSLLKVPADYRKVTVPAPPAQPGPPVPPAARKE